jgi:hypothetical protein
MAAKLAPVEKGSTITTAPVTGGVGQMTEKSMIMYVDVYINIYTYMNINAFIHIHLYKYIYIYKRHVHKRMNKMYSYLYI